VKIRQAPRHRHGDPERSAIMPELPTIAEQGCRDSTSPRGWAHGAVENAARGHPAPVRRDRESAGNAEMKEFIAGQGSEPALLDPAKYGDSSRAEMAKWGRSEEAA